MSRYKEDLWTSEYDLPPIAYIAFGLLDFVELLILFLFTLYVLGFDKLL